MHSFARTRIAVAAVGLIAWTGCRNQGATPGESPRAAAVGPATPAPTPATAGRDAASEPASPRSDAERVTFRTDDGWTLAGELRATDAGPAVVLVHQLASTRAEWAPLVARLRSPDGRRLTTLAIDLRGHGESTAGPDGYASWQSFGTDAQRWAGVERDVAAAVAFLRERGRRPTALVLVGSSIGSSAALRYAAGDEAVVGVVALSPGVAYRGLDTLAPVERIAGSSRAALLVASEGDAGSTAAVSALLARAQGHAAVTSLLFAGTSAHGVAMATGHPELWPRVNEWIRATLFGPPAPTPATQAPALEAPDSAASGGDAQTTPPQGPQG